MKMNAKAQTNLNIEDIVAAKTETMDVEACHGNNKLSGQLGLTAKHGQKSGEVAV